MFFHKGRKNFLPAAGLTGAAQTYMPDGTECEPSGHGPVIKNEELCTVGSDHAVITWVTPGKKVDTTVYMGEDPSILVKHSGRPDTEYHLMEVRGLKPSTRYWYSVESAGARGSLNSFRTLPAPEGKQIFSVGLIGDVHIAYRDSVKDVNEKYFGKLSEYSDTLFKQCIRDLKERNIDLALLIGDLTDSASERQYQGLRDSLLPVFGHIPYFACIGNHDKYLKYSGLGEQGFLKYVANREKTFTSFTFMDHQFILIDSCVQDENWGYIGEEQLEWVKGLLKKGTGRPTFLFLHHPCNGLDVWLGVKDYRRFQQTIRRFPDVKGVFYGHMHHHKVTTSLCCPCLTGKLPYVELPATVQFPCSYAVVRVYEKGFEYNSYKINRVDLSEMSRERTIFKVVGRAAFNWYSFGGIGDRSFSLMNGRLHRPKQYELSVTMEHPKAMELYGRAQSSGGASLAPAAETGKTRVILGRHESFHLVFSAHLQKISRYGVKARIIKEGSFGLPDEVKINNDFV